MNIEKFNLENIVGQLTDAISSERKRIIVDSPQQTYVLLGDGEIYEEYTRTHNLQVLNTPHTGSSIVIFSGDIEIAHFGGHENGFGRNFVDSFCQWLKNKGLSAENDSNDLLVDGYKVLGWSTRIFGKTVYTAVHIGINTNLDTIAKVCKKPMLKIPKGLAEFGVTTKEVSEWITSFVENQTEN